MQNTKYQLRLSAELNAAIHDAAERGDQPVARWLRAAIKEKLARESAGKKPNRKNRADKN